MLYVLLAIVCWISTALGVAWFDRVRRHRRGATLAEKGRALGFAFEETGQPFQNTDVKGLTAAPQGPATSVADLLRGRCGVCSMVIFDQAFCNDFALTLQHTTCAAFRCPAGRLPVFQLETRDFLDRLRASLRHEPAALSDPDFLRHFLLLCPDLLAARDYFTPARQTHLRQHADRFRIEATKDWLLVFRPGRTVSANALGDFVQATSTLALGLLPEDSRLVPAA